MDAQYIAHRYAAERMNFEDEPMPDFSEREEGKLESCLAEPFQTFDGKPLHYTFFERAAVLFYLVAKNHCFPNGNKRMAVTLTSVFFFLNGRWLDVPDLELYKIANMVAESAPRQKDVMIKLLMDIFKTYGRKLT